MAAVSTHAGDRAPEAAAEQEAQARIRAWTAEVAAKTGVALKGGKQQAGGGDSGSGASAAASVAASVAAAAVPPVPPPTPAAPAVA